MIMPHRMKYIEHYLIGLTRMECRWSKTSWARSTLNSGLNRVLFS